jgi:1-deoxy-D-xylulose-5-phosphate reductoisomerase
MKRITILGSTGSIGQSTLDVVGRNSDAFKVVALTAGRNIDLFERQIRAFAPEVVAVADARAADALGKRVNGVEILSGPEGINQVAAYVESDFVLSSIVGAAGLMPTVAAIRAGKEIGLANKESLVMAGEIVMGEAKRSGVRIIPVDSEHSAVFQCIEGRQRTGVRRIILTASGGPFFDRKKEELAGVTAKDALRHPNWNMGRKITIDSATLMNKGLEVIEACRLFDMPAERVSVLVHPQSIVHSMVEFRDRSCIAQMSVPDMRGPISFALAYPERIDDPIPALELERVGSLTFRRPDHEAFPCLSYAYDALKEGGTMPCVLNAANEVAVYAFLEGGIGFQDIARVIRKTMDGHQTRPVLDFGDVIDADRQARETAVQHVKESGK